MSALVAVVGDSSPPSVDAAGRMLAAAVDRGADDREVSAVDGAVLGVARQAWECAAWIGGPAAVARDADVSVVADAALYYRDDLRRALDRAGVRAAGASASHLIAAAYHAWGDDCLDRLEGDFAFVLWDAARRRTLAARDFVGSRSLYHATVGERLVVASSIRSVLASPGVSDELNLVAVAETAGVSFAASRDTVYRAVSRLGAGERLVREWGRPAVVSRYWTPPHFLGEAQPRVRAEEAAEELQRLIVAAAGERVAPEGLTAVFMSGGADSPAVFAGARESIRRQESGSRRVEPVSVSFPVGDSGREDEYIQAIADRWQSPVHWVSIGDVVMFDRAAERAAGREEPFGHPFELFNRVLAERAVAAGARVALNGLMGDPLFQLSPIYLADLVGRGRPVSAVREWRATGGRGARQLFRWALQPLLPDAVLGTASRALRGRPVVGYLDRPLAPWIAPAFAKAHGLEERERSQRPRREAEPLSSYEVRLQLLYPFFARIYGAVFDVQRDAGIEARSPLADGRIVRFAATRPRAERNYRGDTKLLLRRAMVGLLPTEVLEKRLGKTGTLSSYIANSIRQNYDQLFDRAFTGSMLGQLGLVDERVLRERARVCAADMANQDGPWIMFTLLTELWLRGRFGSASSVTPDVHSDGPRIAQDDHIRSP